MENTKNRGNQINSNGGRFIKQIDINKLFDSRNFIPFIIIFGFILAGVILTIFEKESCSASFNYWMFVVVPIISAAASALFTKIDKR